jgi:serine/threonine protein kinase
VYLVRRPERVAARKKSFEDLKVFSGQDLSNPKAALAFSMAVADIARMEDASELGALKQFNPRAAGPEAEAQARERMRIEIAVLQSHLPGLLQLLDSSESDAWIVTEYMPEGTLDRHLARYRGNAKLAISELLPLVKTVAGLHSRPIVHRDIKPQNIFVGKDGGLVLGDFGIAFLPNQPERPTFTGESVGPRDFMPPWVLIDEHPNITPSFDVYMLGKVLWCMVSGKLKLHREDFLDARLDLTKMFPDDPNMYIVNRILSKCVVTRERDCLSSAHDLLSMISEFVRALDRDGQLLEEPVPRPCHVCGVGEYRVRARGPRGGGLRIWTANQTLSLPVDAYACDNCGHIQFFTDPKDVKQ